MNALKIIQLLAPSTKVTHTRDPKVYTARQITLNPRACPFHACEVVDVEKLGMTVILRLKGE